MKHLTLSIVIMVIFSTTAISQMHLGIRGGIYSTWVTADKVEIGTKDVDFSNKSNLGFHVGIVAEYKTSRVFIQPELLYSSVRCDINIDPSEEGLTELELKKIDLPVMVGFKIGAFKFQAGPMASVLIKDKSFFKDITNSDLRLNSTTFGFQAGVGVDVSRLTLDLKYERMLSRLDDDITNTNDNFNARLNQLVFSIGLFFQDR
ncbi:MAG: PorT family protein [Bacteroidales bacterium]|nr:PorT family protein [Bacteroidales bacterium]